MTLTLKLSSELEQRLNAEAARRGLPVDECALRVLDAGVPPEPMPKNGAELVAYWQREGLIGTRPDITDSLEHARAIRRKAERRERD